MSSAASTTGVVIGMDPHKRSVTIQVMAADEAVLDNGRFGTDPAGFAAMLDFARRFSERVWAIEGCAGIGRHVATRLIAEGERIVDVPAKLSYRVRLLTSGNGRKTDDTDAHSIALVGVRVSGLRPVVADEQVELLRVLVDRRRMLGEEHTRKISQLHRLLLELIPGGAKLYLSARQARKLLTTVRPRDAAGKARKHLALELVTDLEKVYARSKAADRDLTAALKETGTTLTDVHGIGPTGAAMLLVEVGDITRFPDRNHFASWTGTAPIDASSGDVVRHRLSRRGNRQINRVLHIMATVQLRHPTEGRAYFDRKKATGKSSMEAMRCLIGGVSGPRSGSRSGRGSSVASGDGLVAEPLDGQFEYGHLRRAEAPGPALGTCPTEGRTMRNRRRASTPRSQPPTPSGDQDELRRLGLGKSKP